MTISVRDFIASFGPAWVVIMTNVDAPSVITAAETGALYGYGLVWLVLLLTVPLFLFRKLLAGSALLLGKDLILASS